MANAIVALISEKDIIHAIKFLFPKFSQDSQQIILKRFKSLFPQVSNSHELNQFNDYVDTLINIEDFKSKKVELLKSMIISLFVETIIHQCIDFLPVNLSQITIDIGSCSLICLNIAEHLERFSELTSIQLCGSYFNYAEMNIIQSLKTLPTCESITFENVMLTYLFFDYLKEHFKGCTEENLTEVKDSLGFKKLNSMNLKSEGRNISPQKLELLKCLPSCQNLTINLISPISNESVEELKKHFNVNGNN